MNSESYIAWYSALRVLVLLVTATAEQTGEGRGVREREDETRQTSEEQKQRGGDVFLINSRFYVLNSLYIIILNKT